jgi:hypothetical protein
MVRAIFRALPRRSRLAVVLVAFTAFSMVMPLGGPAAAAPFARETGQALAGRTAAINAAQATVNLPAPGSAVVQGQVSDALGVPLTGSGAFVILYRFSTQEFAAATDIFLGVAAARGIPPGREVVRATPLDSGGNYCFGSASTGTGSTGPCASQPPLPADSYVVAVIDDRRRSCQVGAIGSSAACGSLFWVSQQVIAQVDRVTTVNAQLQPRFAPGVPPGTNSRGAFGTIVDAGTPGGESSNRRLSTRFPCQILSRIPRPPQQ